MYTYEINILERPHSAKAYKQNTITVNEERFIEFLNCVGMVKEVDGKYRLFFNSRPRKTECKVTSMYEVNNGKKQLLFSYGEAKTDIFDLTLEDTFMTRIKNYQEKEAKSKTA